MGGYQKKQEVMALQKALIDMLLMHTARLRDESGQLTQDKWLSTRELADAINVNIYRARRLLLEMASKGDVIVTFGSVNNSLRWYPTAKYHNSPESLVEKQIDKTC